MKTAEEKSSEMNLSETREDPPQIVEEESAPPVKKSRTRSPERDVSPCKYVARKPIVVKATCSCGKPFNARNGGWRNHLASCKASGIVTCVCGKVRANSSFTSADWARFNSHVIECSMEVDSGNA